MAPVDSPIMNSPVFSLTPNFSWALSANANSQPFQRFSGSLFQTVETALCLSDTQSTWLKPGVSESGTQITPPSAGELS
jgi:hypothetical protein